ncbi:pol-like protein [Lasius niger]|uniref:Pol-like protein n=1 Tax=Lasius niger TaxID=67767 RepID=A0A0J7KGB4_LASNI|nr:pol-like protein [Lasius niger]
MEYKCLTFPLNNSSIMSQLNKIQYQAIRLCLGLRRTTPTNIILAEAAEPPLRIRFEYLTSKYTLKIFSLDTHPVIDKLYALLWYSRNSRKKDPSDHEALISFPDVIITTDKEAEEIKNSFLPQIMFMNIYSTLLNSHTVFYTDASKTAPGNYVGFAVYSPSPHIQLLFKTSSYSSVFTAEALAILYALKHILSHSVLHSVIFTDSQSVTEALISLNLGHSYNYIIHSIRQKLHEINLAGLSNKIVWIPAHSLILGNETADHLAKRAITDGQLVPDLLPHSDLFTIPREDLIRNTTNHLKTQGTHKGKTYFNSFEEFKLKPWLKKIKSGREGIVTCCRIRSCHYALNHSLHRCNLITDPSCPCGFPIQDADHIFWDCPIPADSRTTLLNRLLKLKKYPPYKIQDLLINPSGVIRVKSLNLSI